MALLNWMPQMPHRSKQFDMLPILSFDANYPPNKYDQGTLLPTGGDTNKLLESTWMVNVSQRKRKD
jgi:hypothetical protein